jgi:hypothetical protein
VLWHAIPPCFSPFTSVWYQMNVTNAS